MKQNLQRQLERLRDDLGAIGFAGIALLALTALFLALVLKPMQEKNRLLEASLARHGGAAGPADSAAKLQTFYAYLGRNETATDWLAKLYGIGRATGVELQSATYRTTDGEKARLTSGGGKIERYEITMPVTGSYKQLREFLRRALAELPVLSLDQMTLKRESRNDGAVQAELKMTLHLVKP